MARKGQAIFLVYTDLSDPQYEEEFNAWYNTEHLPELLALPGFLDAARYVATRGGPKYLAAYDLESIDAMQTARVQGPATDALGPARLSHCHWQKPHTHRGTADLPKWCGER